MDVQINGSDAVNASDFPRYVAVYGVVSMLIDSFKTANTKPLVAQEVVVYTIPTEDPLVGLAALGEMYPANEV